LTRRWHPGERVLELGCGTGVEAAALAQTGILVTAIDVAPAMLAQTKARCAAAGVGERVDLHRMAASNVGDLLNSYAPGSFAGAYSSFGPLNCEPELGQVADGLQQLVRPGGRVVISVINRFHPFEFAWYASHGDLKRAVRRWGGYAEGTVSPTLPDRVPTHYYTPRAFTRRFQPGFRVVSWRALLLFLPPPYLAHLCDRHPRYRRFAAGLDRSLASKPVLRGLGDHFLIELERC
ncbi:MAG TPA: class I SAM-dependent methyltransferase, partial [Chloroflexota bacterium]|nr:class I SAM-dependent methyltransferase [Chloroflexota bacterium]